MMILAHLHSESFLSRLLHQGASLLNGVELTPAGTLALDVATYDDSPENVALLHQILAEVLPGIHADLRVSLKLKGCSAGGGGCPTKSSGAGCGSGCGSGGGCSSGGCGA